MLSSVNTSNSISTEKDSKRHTGRVLLVVFLALLVLCSLFLYLESGGSSVTEFADRLAVKSYLKKHYGAEEGEFTVRFTGYDQVRERYEYECECTSGTFRMTCKRFKVRYDGYFYEFKCSRRAETAVDAYIKQYFAGKWSGEDKQATLDINASIRVPEASADAYSAEDGFDIPKLLTDFGGTVELEATLNGGQLSFEQYKNLAYELLNTLRGGLKVPPEFMQVYYYRAPSAENGETEPVLAYESHLVSYMFNYNRSGYLGATNVNFIVETGAKQERSLRRYTAIRVVNFAVIGLVVVGLGTLWIVRKVKKQRKYRKGAEALDAVSTEPSERGE